jgi:hypothetical protein
MRRIEALSGHLKAAARERRQASDEAGPLGELPFITLSRQAGARGGSLARAILAEFEKHAGEPRLQGWHSFDEELCRMIVSDPEINVSFRELITEDFRTRAEDFVSVMLGKSFQDDVQKRISVTLRQLALAGKAILIGRGGVAITRDLGGGPLGGRSGSRAGEIDEEPLQAGHRRPAALRRDLEHRHRPAGSDRPLGRGVGPEQVTRARRPGPPSCKPLVGRRADQLASTRRRSYPSPKSAP